ncbi:MAG: cobyric acid synthase [Negativicoccus succinicivorans]|uniref:cobyric acid synthase n=1 Tax=Negativicoccus succinicivorans TaxID=620903 RepID=UPI002906929C|nr:cobyric acid synthase [Negativicoccus succinicivorans]MDU5914693.1 cobyric acid synthase [Negativicoccus succinicivorans]
MAKTIMFQGTSSHVGKSILTTALCRILLQDGYRVTPFKAQNMALNSYVTKAGDEIGRAQVAQAEAAGMDPIVQMNPVLLKPSGNQTSQVVLMGKPVGVYSAREYHEHYSLTAWDKVKESVDYLRNHFDVVVIEGAGSPAEVNLKATDIVNMRVALELDAPVVLVADIDRGGALAAVVGTLELLTSEERAHVKGIVINKFRGDIKLLEPAIDFLEEKTKIPVLGVVPYLQDLGIDNEDSVSLADKKLSAQAKELEIAVLQTPKISNFTDFDVFSHEPDVEVRYVRRGDSIGHPDVIILPGSKNTTEDLLYLQQFGYVDEIRRLAKGGTPVIGICGGYQMLGEEITDPQHVESKYDRIDGIGLLPLSTEMAGTKTTNQVKFSCRDFSFLDLHANWDDLAGYEIHMGKSVFTHHDTAAFHITERSLHEVDIRDGLVTADGNCFGTYIHGIFDNDELRRGILNALRKKKGLAPLPVQFRLQEYKESEYDRLAATVREALNMDLVYELLELAPTKNVIK